MTGSVADQIDGREFARTLLSHDIVDLSIALDECLPCAWPRHAGYQHSIFNWFEALERTPADAHDRLGAYYTATLHMDEHSGTHIDAPAHHIPRRSLACHTPHLLAIPPPKRWIFAKWSDRRG